MVLLGEVQPCHWLVGQTLQYAGLGGASLTSGFLERQISRKRPRPQQRAGQVGQTWRLVKPTSRPNPFCHKWKLRTVMAITFCRGYSVAVACRAGGRGRRAPPRLPAVVRHKPCAIAWRYSQQCTVQPERRRGLLLCVQPALICALARAASLYSPQSPRVARRRNRYRYRPADDDIGAASPTYSTSAVPTLRSPCMISPSCVGTCTRSRSGRRIQAVCVSKQ